MAIFGLVKLRKCEIISCTIFSSMEVTMYFDGSDEVFIDKNGDVFIGKNGDVLHQCRCGAEKYLI